MCIKLFLRVYPHQPSVTNNDIQATALSHCLPWLVKSCFISYLVNSYIFEPSIATQPPCPLSVFPLRQLHLKPYRLRPHPGR